MRSPRAIALACVAAVFLLAAYGLAQLATNDRDDVVAVATPPPIQEATPVTLAPGRELCEGHVALDADARVIRVYSGSPTPDVPRIRVTVTGDGWRTSALSPEPGQAGGGADGIYDTRIGRPPRSMLATVCIASAEPGREAILAGSDEDRVRSRAPVRVDGRPIETRVALIVLAGSPRSPLSQARSVLEHASAFQPGPVGWVGLGLALLVVGLGAPALTVYVILRALRDDTSGTN